MFPSRETHTKQTGQKMVQIFKTEDIDSSVYLVDDAYPN